ncbi:MAG: GDP-mannose mannosyl hydrolase [Pseudomonadales bacterium]|nr:GDP-mannose mannosyl hydrolase [Pseudomonadales bacterium]
MSRYLETNDFLSVVRDTPLVSIDLIVFNENGQVLLGQRCNKPAQGFWFVPGGRIQKDESLDEAFIRLTTEELGFKMTRNEAKFKGVYEHFYADNFAAMSDVTTHYVVLAYQIFVSSIQVTAPLVQHSKYLWKEPIQIVSDDSVHHNTRIYFE